jgi:aminoglycoside 6'-N-acetyltransferase
MSLPQLNGHLVRLRQIAPSDRARVIEIRQNSAVAQWWRGDNLDAEFDNDLTDDNLNQFAIENADGSMVGMIQFGEEGDPDYRHASIDLYVDPAFHRKGIAGDAIATLVNYLFDERAHHRLVIDPSVDNTAAIACYSKVGFKPVGTMRAYERRADGTWSDGLLMDMLKTDR